MTTFILFFGLLGILIPNGPKGPKENKPKSPKRHREIVTPDNNSRPKVGHHVSDPANPVPT